MSCKFEHLSLSGRTLHIAVGDNPRAVLVQPVDSHDLEERHKLIDYIDRHSDVGYMHVAVPVSHWNDELTPWPAPPAFGKIPFGDGAGSTLDFIVGTLMKSVSSHYSLGPDTRWILGGYSLAGLFSLWASCQHHFDGAVAASPSVWYPGWMDYSKANVPVTPRIYLSLGDREEHTKTQIMKTVGQDIRLQYQLLQEKGIDSVLEINAGNHFQDNGERTAKGFVWCLSKMS